MNAAARSAVLTVQAVLIFWAERWLANSSDRHEIDSFLKVLVLAGGGLFVAAVLIALKGDRRPGGDA